MRAPLLACLLVALFLPGVASGADMIYWANLNANTIRVANLDGTGAASTLFAEAGGSGPAGVAIDPAANRIYWANASTNTIRVANLDGTGAASTLFAEAGGSGPFGVAIDPAANRIYWANRNADTIRVANLDGTGGASTLFAEAGGSLPIGVAIDPAAGKIYWASANANAIRVANLDGTGAASTLFAEPGGSQPVGVAIDPAAGKIYWPNLAAHTIRVANLDGTGAASTLFAEAGGGAPAFTTLLRSPVGIAAPQISGGGQLGGQLSCGQGAWAPNLLGAFLFRAPRAFAYQWQRDGVDVGGATASAYTPTATGSYACRLTASNQAGSTSQTSSSLTLAQDPKCKPLRKKLKRQKSKFARAVSEAKRSMIEANIKDTKKRLRKLGC